MLQRPKSPTHTAQVWVLTHASKSCSHVLGPTHMRNLGEQHRRLRNMEIVASGACVPLTACSVKRKISSFGLRNLIGTNAIRFLFESPTDRGWSERGRSADLISVRTLIRFSLRSSLTNAHVRKNGDRTWCHDHKWHTYQTKRLQSPKWVDR